MGAGLVGVVSAMVILNVLNTKSFVVWKSVEIGDRNECAL
jgi:hypothetical protein